MTLEELQLLKASLEAELLNQQLQVTAAQGRLDSLQSQITTAQSDVTTGEAQVSDTQAKIADVQAQIDAFSSPSTGVLLGISGSKEIDGACQRSFTNGKISGPISRPSKAACPRMHHSWKVVGSGGKITLPTDAAMTKALANFLLGDEVEVEHEIDAKDRKGEGATMLTARLKAKADFYAQVKRLRPDLFVVHTLTSYAFEPKYFAKIEKYYAKADVLGADLDGGKFPHDYGESKRLANIQAWADKHYNGVWTNPEFGWSDDPQGGRMSVITSQIAAIAAFGPKEIQYHNNPSFGATFTTAELAEYAQLVHQFNG